MRKPEATIEAGDVESLDGARGPDAEAAVGDYLGAAGRHLQIGASRLEFQRLAAGGVHHVGDRRGADVRPVFLEYKVGRRAVQLEVQERRGRARAGGLDHQIVARARKDIDGPVDLQRRPPGLVVPMPTLPHAVAKPTEEVKVWEEAIVFGMLAAETLER